MLLVVPLFSSLELLLTKSALTEQELFLIRGTSQNSPSFMAIPVSPKHNMKKFIIFLQTHKAG